ncbi:STM3941 family protein [Shouchella patagoniensis]|uniref:STM3941 family protein n=1 Tax=Shouchella patagoniensis TaxID=228576 RepID=UPI000994A86B|nr:STM3941 family protein [Shouchella patagoniensis]
MKDQLSKPIVVFPPKRTMALLAFGALVFVVMGFNLLSLTGPEHDASYNTLLAIIGYASILFFGFCFVYAVYRMISPKPSLRIDENGIYDNASVVGAGLVHWDEIRSLPIYHYAGQVYLGIELHDVDAVIRRQPFPKRFILYLNKSTPGLLSPFNIPKRLLPMALEDVQEVARPYIEHAYALQKN